MRSPRPVETFVAVVAVVGIALGTLTALRPPVVAAEDPPRGRVPVSSTALVCPDPGAPGENGRTEITYAAPRVAGTSSIAGDTAVAGALDPDAPPRATLEERGPVTLVGVELEEAPPVVLRALGSLAPGLAGMQVTRADDGDAQGLAGVTCPEAGTSAWFVGTGTEIGHRPRLVLVNPEQAPAELDVVLHGPAGEVAAPAARNLVVPARDVVTLELDALAPDLEQLAVQVVVRTGRVASALRDTRVDGLDPQGLDWVPAADGDAARRLVVAGVPGGGGPRLLQLLAPGALDARVEVRLLTASGPITPVGLEELDLTAGSVREVDLAEAAGGEPVSVELVSDQPVVAGVRAVLPFEDGQAEMAYAATVPPLTGPATATDARVSDTEAATLLLTADPDLEEVGAVVTSVDPGTGEVVRTERITVAPGATTPVALEAPAGGDRLAVVVLPTGAGLRAVLQLTETVPGGSYATLVPLRAPELDVEVPRVRYDLSTGLRRD